MKFYEKSNDREQNDKKKQKSSLGSQLYGDNVRLIKIGVEKIKKKL